jgi:hypothetical protein
MGEVIVGSEEVARGTVTRHELQRWYRPLYQDVYVPKQSTPTLRDRTIGAWLWSHRRATIAGVAASALHGAYWVEGVASIELNWRRSRSHPGLIVREEYLPNDERTRVARLPVTTPARTAYDLGRHLPRGEALARMDALTRAMPFSAEDVLLIAKRHGPARGVRQLRELLPLVDGGAASPKETWLRLLLIDAGFPKPTTQIPAVEGRGQLVRMLDMGWENFMVAAEYDGDQHRTDRPQYVKDLRVHAKLVRLGWIVVRVIKEDRAADIIQHVHEALTSRGWKGQARKRSRRSSATSSSSSGAKSPTTFDSSRSAS